LLLLRSAFYYGFVVIERNRQKREAKFDRVWKWWRFSKEYAYAGWSYSHFIANDTESIESQIEEDSNLSNLN